MMLQMGTNGIGIIAILSMRESMPVVRIPKLLLERAHSSLLYEGHQDAIARAARGGGAGAPSVGTMS